MVLRIMVVEDEPEVLNLVRAMAEGLGCEVVTLADSSEAVRRLESERYDGVFIDLGMSHLDGFELSKRVRASKRNKAIPA